MVEYEGSHGLSVCTEFTSFRLDQVIICPDHYRTDKRDTTRTISRHLLTPCMDKNQDFGGKTVVITDGRRTLE